MVEKREANEKHLSKEQIDEIIQKMRKPEGEGPLSPGYQECGEVGGAHHCDGDFKCSKPFTCHGIHLNE